MGKIVVVVTHVEKQVSECTPCERAFVSTLRSDQLLRLNRTDVYREARLLDDTGSFTLIHQLALRDGSGMNLPE